MSGAAAMKQSLPKASIALIFLAYLMSAAIAADPPVTWTEDTDTLILENGLFRVAFAKPEGYVLGIAYGPKSSQEDVLSSRKQAGYFNLNWSPVDTDAGPYDIVLATSYAVDSGDTKVEVTFTRPYVDGAVPLTLETRYLLKQGDTALYMYHKLTHEKSWPDFKLQQLRSVWRLDPGFDYAIVADDRQREMPGMDDLDPSVSSMTEIPEARLLEKPKNDAFKGEVDDKYHYTADYDEQLVYGWTRDASTGVWIITPNHECKGGGPAKQDLTLQVDPLLLKMLHSRHYGTPAVLIQDEDWSKVYGPYLLYVNSGSDNEELWADAKDRAEQERKAWPYDDLFSDPSVPGKRTRVSGTLSITDRFDSKVNADGAYVGMVAPGKGPNWWQDEVKGYQFWCRAEPSGNFVIPFVRPGTYNLFAFKLGVLGTFQAEKPVVVEEGTSTIRLGDLEFKVPRFGPKMWEIGVPDRRAREFYIPKLNPLNKKYPYDVTNPNRFRDYGAWDAYARTYPKKDLVYKVGDSDFSTDWFFVQPLRLGSKKNTPTVWRIDFELTPSDKAEYVLRVAIAAAHQTALTIALNDPEVRDPIFDSGIIGNDNALARASDHGDYFELEVRIKGSDLKRGVNSIFLKQRVKTSYRFTHIMYDYLRMEGPVKE